MTRSEYFEMQFFLNHDILGKMRKNAQTVANELAIVTMENRSRILQAKLSLMVCERFQTYIDLCFKHGCYVKVRLPQKMVAATRGVTIDLNTSQEVSIEWEIREDPVQTFWNMRNAAMTMADKIVRMELS